MDSLPTALSGKPLSSLTSDLTRSSALEAWSLNHWTTREVPSSGLVKLNTWPWGGGEAGGGCKNLPEALPGAVNLSFWKILNVAEYLCFCFSFVLLLSLVSPIIFYSSIATSCQATFWTFSNPQTAPPSCPPPSGPFGSCIYPPCWQSLASLGPPAHWCLNLPYHHQPLLCLFPCSLFHVVSLQPLSSSVLLLHPPGNNQTLPSPCVLLDA